MSNTLLQPNRLLRLRDLQIVELLHGNNKHKCDLTSTSASTSDARITFHI